VDTVSAMKRARGSALDFFQTGSRCFWRRFTTAVHACTQILNGVASSLKARLGSTRGFRNSQRSFDRKIPGTGGCEEADLPAALRPAEYGQRWHFLTGDRPYQALMDAVGFHYKYDPPPTSRAPSGSYLTPGGKLRATSTA